MPTKSALTYVVTSVTRTATPSSMQSVATTTPTITSNLQTQTSSTPFAFVDTISSFPAPTSSAAPTSAPVAAAAEDKPRMTPAQIAGLSVAAVAAFVLAIGLMALSIWLRRRRERRNTLLPDEKGRRPGENPLSTRFSRYVPVESDPEPTRQFPAIPVPAFRRGRSQRAARPVQRLGVGTSNSSSNSSLPLDQIGVAISAELDGKPLVPKKTTEAITQQQKLSNKRGSNSFRPVSTMTQETVFEEDELPPHRRSSVLLPTPPVPIPPIRALQPSRTPPKLNNNALQGSQQSELSLNIPVRHERSQPKRIIPTETPSNGSSQPPQPVTRPRLAPPFQMNSTATSYESKATTASSRDASTSGDIIDYYFSNHQSRETTPKASPAYIIRPKESPKAVQINPKKSQSTLSRTTIRTSTNHRDSASSQTSFETSDANDPTPEDEDDEKQLSDDSSSNQQQLSPVAESPISKLRYPKVPRASNQMVARSPRSPPLRDFRSPPPRDFKSPPPRDFRSPHRAPDASSLLQKRNNALPPLLLESRPRLESPHRDPFTSPPRVTSPPRRARSHMRSNSTESWNTTPASKKGIDRKSRVQSGAWGKSPVMYEEDVVRPLNVRRKRDEMTELNIGRDVDVDYENDGLKSPLWIPRLTPRKKGEDMFLEVGWGDGVGR